MHVIGKEYTIRYLEYQQTVTWRRMLSLISCSTGSRSDLLTV